MKPRTRMRIRLGVLVVLLALSVLWLGFENLEAIDKLAPSIEETYQRYLKWGAE